LCLVIGDDDGLLDCFIDGLEDLVEWTVGLDVEEEMEGATVTLLPS